MVAETSYPALALALTAVVLAVVFLYAEVVWLDLPQSGTKYVSEEIQSNVVVLADYALMYESHPSSHPTIVVKVLTKLLVMLSIFDHVCCSNFVWFHISAT
ncbi:hypothetical protein GUJ93_ZPchr0008g12170 [Zizania palustris]|uniref:Uncharacterized protein n=1 Tax=Zizania palustris TaxID=103762 RepID=A0A8J5RIJ1_ZIZPA|nr:hypothetical protein GUJ93_ZPchr0008g12170 [Zizania palustris]